MGYKVRLTFHAEKDLQNIILFIGQDNPAAALDTGLSIRERLRTLENFPHAGHSIVGFEERALREIIYSHYRMIYEVDPDEKHINVIRIWHGARGNPRIPRIKR